jgi:hypothetical protein
MRHLSFLLVSTVISAGGTSCFSFGLPLGCRSCTNRHQSTNVVTYAEKPPSSSTHKLVYSKIIGSTLLIGSLVFGGMLPVRADEIGVEKEAPTVFTGESVMVRAENPILVFLCNSLR